MPLDLSRLQRNLRVAHRPFDFLSAHGLLDAADRERLLRDFPRYGSAGFFPYRERDCGESVRALVAELVSPAFADALGAHLGIAGLGAKPALVTVCESLNRRHGTIHTDSASKLATALLYLEPDWPRTSAGCLRLLARGDDIEALAAPEVRPTFGNFVAFRRADNSWHGHLPYEGVRRVIQVAWLTSAEELQRKTRRGGLSRRIKRFVGELDRRWGSGRGDSARHG
jgi:hypothetical protein